MILAVHQYVLEMEKQMEINQKTRTPLLVIYAILFYLL